MYLGETTFICRSCGNKFKAPAYEWAATVFIAPQPCPQCSSMRTRPVGLIAWLEDAKYKHIWEANSK